MLKPGTDAALACAVMHVLLSEGLADRDYLMRYTDFNEQTEAHFATRTPAWAASITGLSEQDIIQFARMYGSTKRSFLRIGYGFTRSRNGAVNMHAVSCLPAMTGAWINDAGGALHSMHGIFNIDKTLICAMDVPHSHTRVLDQSRIGPILCGSETDLQNGPPVKALFIQNTNPAVVAPDTNTVLTGLARDDLFTVVHEQFMTDTARWGDIVLPATMFLEHDDIYAAGAHTHMQIGPKLIEAPGECRSNHEVLQALFERFGLSHPANDLTARELIAATLRASGYPDIEEVIEAGGVDRGTNEEVLNFHDGFATPDKRFHFAPDWSSVGPYSKGMPSMPDFWDVIDSANEQHPFRLVTAPARQFLNTSFTETPTSVRMEKQPFVLIHPDDMQALGLASGALLTLGNELGEVTVESKVFDGVQPGTVVVESLWPNHRFINGVGINSLISAEPGKPNGGAVFHDTAIWVKPAAEPVVVNSH
jgi:anaerobic selenocysteine-containing dehydrogenase